MISQDEHLAWAKKRALEYVEAGELLQAFTSMGSDLNKHPELKNHIGIELGMMLLLVGSLSSPEAMRRWINGFR